MESIKSPTRKLPEYHFCVRVTPKTVSKGIFQERGIEKQYKLQIEKKNKKQSHQIMKRNLHQQALQGFYRSQSCYFTLTNYSNFQPLEMKLTFSQLNSAQQEEKVIFVYKFSTYSLVKNFNENGVRRSTQVLTKDFETEFYIDFYIQSNKARLEDKVRSDSNKQMLKKKHFKQMHEDEKDSQRMKKSVVESNYSPSKSSHRASSTLNYRKTNTRASTPLFDADSNKRRVFIDKSQDNRSQKLSHSRGRNRSSSNLNDGIQIKNFRKKYPSSRLSYGDLIKEDDIISDKFKKSQQQPTSYFRAKQSKTLEANQMGQREKSSLINLDLKSKLSIEDVSLNTISLGIKKNIVVIIFVALICFIVGSRALDSDFGKGFHDQKDRVRRDNKKNKQSERQKGSEATNIRGDRNRKTNRIKGGLKPF